MHMEVSGEWRSLAVFIIAASMLLIGIAKSPRMPFVGTYVDDNVPKEKTAVYMGIIKGLNLCGPAIGFVLGGVFSKLYITLEETNLTPSDPRWMGAWWLGFLFFGSTCVIAGIPLIFFPRRMRKQTELKAIREIQKKKQKGKAKFCHNLKELIKSVFRLILNPVYVCIMLAMSFIDMGISGAISFMPKYLESQFTLDAWQANIVLGSTKIVSAVLGTICGGWLTSRFKLSPLACLRLACSVLILAIALESLGFVVGCDQPDIESGIHHNSSDTSLAAVCSRDCSCNKFEFFPVCGDDGRNYFSPCHAGCSSANELLEFTNCSCLATNGSQTARGGLCRSECGYMPSYVVLAFLAIFISSLAIVPKFMLLIRCAKEADKPMAIGIGYLSRTLIGSIPGPIIYGAVIDSTCLLWKNSCSSSGACTLYDNNLYRFRFHALMVGFTCLTLLLLTATLLIVLCSKKKFFEQPLYDKAELEATELPAVNGIVNSEKNLGEKKEADKE